MPSGATANLAARGQSAKRGIQAVVENGWMDAPGQVAELVDGLLGGLVRGVDQLEGAFDVGRLTAWAPVSDELSLGAVMQVALDPAQPLRRVVDRLRACALQVAYPLGPRSGAEQPSNQRSVQGDGRPRGPWCR